MFAAVGKFIHGQLLLKKDLWAVAVPNAPAREEY